MHHQKARPPARLFSSGDARHRKVKLAMVHRHVAVGAGDARSGTHHRARWCPDTSPDTLQSQAADLAGPMAKRVGANPGDVILKPDVAFRHGRVVIAFASGDAVDDDLQRSTPQDEAGLALIPLHDHRATGGFWIQGARSRGTRHQQGIADCLSPPFAAGPQLPPPAACQSVYSSLRTWKTAGPSTDAGLSLAATLTLCIESTMAPRTPKDTETKPAAAKPAAKSKPALKVVDEGTPSAPAKSGNLRLKDLVDSVAAATGGKKPEVKKTIEATLAAMGTALATGHSLVVPPLGKMRVAKATAGALTLKLRLADVSKAAGIALADDEEDS